MAVLEHSNSLKSNSVQSSTPCWEDTTHLLKTNMLHMTFCTICPEDSLQTHFLQHRGRRHIGLWGTSCPKGEAWSDAYETKRQKRFCNKWRCLVCTCETFKTLQLNLLNSLWWENVCMATHCRRKFSPLWPGASQFAGIKDAVKPWALVFIWMPTDTNHLLKHRCKPSTPSRHWSPNNLAMCCHTEATQPKECDNEFATSTWPQDRATRCAWKCTSHRVLLAWRGSLWLSVWIDFMGQRASTWVLRARVFYNTVLEPWSVTFSSISGFNVVADKCTMKWVLYVSTRPEQDTHIHETRLPSTGQRLYVTSERGRPQEVKQKKAKSKHANIQKEMNFLNFYNNLSFCLKSWSSDNKNEDIYQLSYMFDHQSCHQFMSKQFFCLHLYFIISFM